ncbi:acetoacetate decarboxylase family protein [Salinigranum marinum]|uniref:acetoacetate decarboxylase family protein n=1 Tax=Salinigranum marinum TaxID=1515595 RepID=UPI002989E6F4|nr:acetoacetate decarboxylase family protein [Salinigranum marinum]
MGTGEPAARRLSTGHDVTLPLSCRARLGGSVFAADWSPLRAALPDDLTPIRLGPRRGAVAVVGIDYHAVGSLDPYREFAVVVPVADSGVAGVPATLSGVGGYVVDLPVTTEPARALGDVWGFPKSVTDVDVEATPRTVDVAVADDGRPDVELSVDVGDAPARRFRRRLTAYAHLDGRLVRIPIDLDAEVRYARGGSGVRLGRGRGRYAAVLRDLGVDPRVYARFVASHATAEIHPPRDAG